MSLLTWREKNVSIIKKSAQNIFFDIQFFPPAIRIDLKNPELRAGTKYYQRVRQALSHSLMPRFNVLVNWASPADSLVCTSSVAKYFADKSYAVELMPTQMFHHQEYSLQMPLLGQDNTDDEQPFYASEHEIVEYIGMLSLGCNLMPTESYLSSYTPPNDCRTCEIGSAKVIQWRGFFSSDILCQLWQALQLSFFCFDLISLIIVSKFL